MSQETLTTIQYIGGGAVALLVLDRVTALSIGLVRAVNARGRNNSLHSGNHIPGGVIITMLNNLTTDVRELRAGQERLQEDLSDVSAKLAVLEERSKAGSAGPSPLKGE